MRKSLLVLGLAAALGAVLLATAGGCGRQGGKRADGGGAVSETAPATSPDTAAGAEAGVAGQRVDLAEEVAMAHILVMHKDSPDCPRGVTRTREEAKERAHRIALLAMEQGADFAELARRYSDDPGAKANGGYVGIFQRGQLAIDFQVAVFALPVGGVSQVLETPDGFHILKRLPVQRVHAHHILVAWEGARRATSAVTRTKAQARALAEEIRLKALAPGADLCGLSRQFSDDYQNGSSCGDLGEIVPGMLPPNVDAVLFKLPPDKVSEILETDFGYHLFWREK